MKRRDLIRTIEATARRRDLRIVWREGGSHTVVQVGGRQTTIPRHREINDLTAANILRTLFGKERA